MRKKMALGPGLVILALAFLCGPAAGQMTAGAISLQIAPSARADAMGAAYTALAYDPYATWWNPAGLAFLGEDLKPGEAVPSMKSFAFTFSELVPDFEFNDVYYSYLSYTQKLGAWSGFGIGVPFITYGEIPIVKEAQGGAGGIQIDTHTPAEFAIVGGYGTRLRNNIGVGASVKVFRSDLAPSLDDPDFDLAEGATGTTFAADLGVLYRMSTLPLAFGATVLNLGPDITYVRSSESSPMPRVFKLGAAYEIYSNGPSTVTGAFDFTKPIVEFRDEPIYGGGLEGAYDFGSGVNVAGRLGYYSEKEGDIQDMTYGVGVRLKWFKFDFASFPQSSVLNHVNRFSVQFWW